MLHCWFRMLFLPLVALGLSLPCDTSADMERARWRAGTSGRENPGDWATLSFRKWGQL